jgi:prolyl 4-hydroxylase
MNDMTGAEFSECDRDEKNATPSPAGLEGSDDSLQSLRALAQAGQPAAMIRLARRLILGEDAPREIDEGVALMKSAAQAGDAEAINQLATLTAAGLGVPQGWDLALDLLQDAAARGSMRARAQLALLTGDLSAAAEIRSGHIASADFWPRVRRSINLETWVRPALPKQVWESPRVWTGENFTSPELCAWLIDKARGRLKPAMMRDTTTGASKFEASRTNSDFVFDILEGEIVMLLLRTRISLATSLPTVNMEPPQIFHYFVGEEIKPHFDFLRAGAHGVKIEGDIPTDRLATFLLYLNDDFDGGDLDFPKGGFRHKGRTADGIFFASYASGEPDRQSLHAALPVTRGEKWILSQWIHDGRFAP